jgi:hypothetical protein
MLEVVAGVMWAEMTLLHRKDHMYDLEELSDEEDNYDPFYYMETKDIPFYIYKVLDSGIPRQPTFSRFKSGLAMHGIPAECIHLYETFINDFKTNDFGRLYETLNRSYVNSDTGNYCSFHSTDFGGPKPKKPLQPTSSEEVVLSSQGEGSVESEEEVAKPANKRGHAKTYGVTKEGRIMVGGKDVVKAAINFDGETSEGGDTDILSGNENGGVATKKPTIDPKTLPVPDELRAETLAQVVAAALSR